MPGRTATEEAEGAGAAVVPGDWAAGGCWLAAVCTGVAPAAAALPAASLGAVAGACLGASPGASPGAPPAPPTLTVITMPDMQ